MNAGLPVVASDVSGLREVVEPTAHAPAGAASRPRAIAEALESLIGDAQKRHDMGEAAFARSGFLTGGQ